jgi:tRNA modification GTPase
MMLDLLEGQPFLIVFNKNDLEVRLDTGAIVAGKPGQIGASSIFTSILTREGLEELEQKILDLVGASQTILSGGILITNERHLDLLEKSKKSLSRAIRNFERGKPGELIMIDMRESIAHLGAIIGEEIGEEILNRIFSKFCIGK